MTEPKRWTVYTCPDGHIRLQHRYGCGLACDNYLNATEVVAAADFDRLRDERDRLAEASETLAAVEESVREGFAAGRAAATPDPPEPCEKCRAWSAHCPRCAALSGKTSNEKTGDEPKPHESERIAEWAAREAEPNPYRSQDQIARDEERQRIVKVLREEAARLAADRWVGEQTKIVAHGFSRAADMIERGDTDA